MADEAKAQEGAVEKQTNCLTCNKQLKRIRTYYRDGKYYCTKRCWAKKVKAPAEQEA
jgi:hypothetical protein